MAHQILKENIAKHVSFPEKELSLFCNSFYPVQLAKKDFLLKQGDICSFEGFVTKGCLRVYTLDAMGNEYILHFAIKDWWITDIDSFTNQTSSHLSIQALEASEVLLINKNEKEALYQQSPNVEKLFRIMTQKTHVALQRRIIRDHSLTADDRYLYFINTYPKIAQRLTNIQLAAYLGISHEFVSKIRRKISQQK